MQEKRNFIANPSMRSYRKKQLMAWREGAHEI